MALYKGIEIPGRPDMENVRKLDLLAMPTIAEMMRFGFAIDVPHLQELSLRLDQEAGVLRRQICDYIPPAKLDEFIARSGIDQDGDNATPMNVDSPSQLSTLLFKVLGVGRGRQLRTMAKGDQISTNKKQLEKLKLDWPVVGLVVKYRERVKLKTTYTDKLPLIARKHPRGKGCVVCESDHEFETMRVHTSILTTRTSTGRPASKNPNLQNIPIRTKLGAEVRKAFVATPGYELVLVDWAQQELRLGAHLSQDANLLRIFDADLDPHRDTAIRAFGLAPGVEPDKITQRDPSKTTNFQIFYGGGPLGVYDTLVTNFGEAGLPVPDWLTLKWVEDFIDQWMTELYPGVGDYLANQHYRARRYECVWTLLGRVRWVPEVRSAIGKVVAAGLRQAGNHPVQGLGADWIKLATAEIQDEVVGVARSLGVDIKPLMMVHDEWIGEVELGWGEVVAKEVKRIMEGVMDDRETGERRFRVKIKADSNVTKRWVKG